MDRPFVPEPLKPKDQRDQEAAKKIFLEIQEGGEKIAQIVALAGGAIILALIFYVANGFISP